MQGYNVIIVYNKKMNNILLCKRRKDPYIGLFNLVGGKIELGEDGYTSAYRELFEETSTTKDDIKLHHLMDFKYYLADCYVEVYAGKLNKVNVMVYGEENELFWSDLNHNFFDSSFYAGEGNIGHMLEIVNQFKEQIFKD